MSEVSDLAFVVDDGVLSDPWTIIRSTGQFVLGGWQTSTTEIPGWGVVSVAKPEDLDMIPEGDRVTGAMVFHSQPRIYATELDGDLILGTPTSTGGLQGDGTQKVSDIMVWNSQRWRVLHVWPYNNRNFWKAIAVRMQGH